MCCCALLTVVSRENCHETSHKRPQALQILGLEWELKWNFMEERWSGGNLQANFPNWNCLAKVFDWRSNSFCNEDPSGILSLLQIGVVQCDASKRISWHGCNSMAWPGSKYSQTGGDSIVPRVDCKQCPALPKRYTKGSCRKRWAGRKSGHLWKPDLWRGRITTLLNLGGTSLLSLRRWQKTTGSTGKPIGRLRHEDDRTQRTVSAVLTWH